MKYKDFIGNENHVLQLMKKLKLIAEISEIRRIDFHPDYDYSDYRGPATQTYFFKDRQSFPGSLYSAYEVSIEETKILHYDDLERIASEVGEPLALDDESRAATGLLNKALLGNPEILDDHGSQEIEQFRLKKIEVIMIDHAEQHVDLWGSFEGDGYAISPDDWNLYARLRFRGFVNSPSTGEFYRQLLIESYLTRLNGDHRVSFFLAFAGLEGFTNWKLKGEGRLGDKLNALFKNTFPNMDISRHEIYTSVVAKFKTELTDLRNAIAHGREVNFGESQSREMLLVALILTCSVEKQVADFESTLNHP